MTTETPTKPVFSKRFGDTEVACWKHKAGTGHFDSITAARSFKDKAGVWQSADITDPNELLIYLKLLTQAQEIEAAMQASAVA